MAIVSSTVAAIAMGVAAAGTVAAAYSSRQGVKAQKKAYAAQQRQADIANMRERRGQVRNMRMLRASVESQSAVSGMTGSSAMSASLGAISSTGNANISFLDQNQLLSQQATVANQRAASYNSRSSTYAAVAGLGMQVASRFG